MSKRYPVFYLIIGLVVPVVVWAHSTIDGVGAKRLLGGLDAALAIRQNGGDSDTDRYRIAGALIEIGTAVNRVVRIANNDLRVHGEHMSPAGRYLLEQLKQRGIELDYWQRYQRYQHYLEPFDAYLKSYPDGAEITQATQSLWIGRFFNSAGKKPYLGANIDRDREELRSVNERMARLSEPSLRAIALQLQVGYLLRLVAATDNDAQIKHRRELDHAFDTLQREYPRSPAAQQTQRWYQRSGIDSANTGAKLEEENNE